MWNDVLGTAEERNLFPQWGKEAGLGMAPQEEGSHLSQPGKQRGWFWYLSDIPEVGNDPSSLARGQCHTGFDKGFTLMYWWMDEWIPGQAQRTKEHITAEVTEAAATAHSGLEKLRLEGSCGGREAGSRLHKSEKELWPQAQGRVEPLKDLGRCFSTFLRL